MFFTNSDIVIYAKRVKETPRLISEELRGWRWSEPPVLPPSNTSLGVSDITGGLCPNGRMVYLRYVKKVKEPFSPELARGSLIHEVYAGSIETIKKIIYEEGKIDGNKLRSLASDFFSEFFKELEKKYSKVPDYAEVAKTVWDYSVNIYASEVEKARARSPFLSKDSLVSLVVPFYVEYPIDGSLVGLSQNLRADALIPQIPIIAEMKTRKLKEVYDLALAGYALAYESVYYTPVDFGLLCNVVVKGGSVLVKCDFKKISDRLRQEFLEERDRRLEIIEKGVDPGLPKQCEPDCPFLNYCRLK
ncbi:MAG: type I-A CRISPR-associated protein Cas4/Csa1 [Sulfolobus sp.]|nr:type I-A CRISPR-associated protein Cas4/Csa1 [Sulfolobus sp.]